MATYKIEVEHGMGGSVEHACKHGVWSDPAESLNGYVIKAATERAAERKFVNRLSRVVGKSAWGPCVCERAMVAGTDKWWNSLCVHASKIG